MVTRYRLLALACIAIAIAVLAVRPVRTAGPFARDFEAYWAAGAASSVHADPYGRAIWNAEHRVPGVDARHDEILPFIGPPHTLLVWRAAERLPYQYGAYVWWVLLAASLLVLVVAILRASGAPITPLMFFAGAALAVSFAPISSDLALGQIALPSFTGAVLVTIFAARSVPAATAAACLAFAQPNAALGLISQIGRNRVTLAIVLGALATYLLGTLTAGWTWPASYARAVLTHGLAERFTAIQFNSASIAYAFGATSHQATIVAGVIAVLAILGAVVLAFVVRDSFPRFAGFSALIPFATGFFHEHDFVVAFAAVLWCALRTKAAARAVALAGTLLAGIDWLGLAQRPSGIAQSALLAVAALATFVALDERLALRYVAPVAVGVAAVFAAAAILAMHNPVPVWPDALGAYHAPAHAGIATVWFEEQRASGLTEAVPAWGMLRSLSLLGCVLLVCAVALASRDRVLNVDVHKVVERRDRARMEVL